MMNIAYKSTSLISKAAAIEVAYLEEALANVENSELLDLQNDISRLENTGTWSVRIIELMKRAKLIADADEMLSRFEAA